MPSCPCLPTWPSKKPLAAMVQLEKSLKKLKKEKNHCTKMAAQEFEKAKEFVVAQNKEAARLCLKMKMLYEEKIEELRNCEYRIAMLILEVQAAEARTETVGALTTAATALKKMQKAINIDYVDKSMDRSSEVMEAMNQIRELLSTAMFPVTDSDVVEIEAGLKKLEEQLPPAATASAAPEHVTGGPLPAPPVSQGSD